MFDCILLSLPHCLSFKDKIINVLGTPEQHLNNIMEEYDAQNAHTSMVRMLVDFMAARILALIRVGIMQNKWEQPPVMGRLEAVGHLDDPADPAAQLQLGQPKQQQQQQP